MKDWVYFNKFSAIIDKYLPNEDEGETKAEQIVTAINKLIYKWYNDGDVFDNTGYLEGWCNNLSSYANWLASNVDGAKKILCGIADCRNGGEYEDLLAKLAGKFLKDSFLETQGEAKIGSIYKCDGPFRFEERYADDEDEEDW